MEREADDARLDAAMNPALHLEGGAASELNTLLQEGGSEEAEEADDAAVRALAAPPPAEVYVAQRVVARWRALMAERKACPLLDMHEALPDLFEQEVMRRLDPTDRTMLAQVGGWRRCWPLVSRGCPME